MQKVKNTLISFIKDESGMEILQFAIVLAITVGLFAVALTIMKTVRGGMSTANSKAEEGFTQVWDDMDGE